MLQKGFLSQGKAIRTERLVGWIILWITISYILYAFFYMLRETFRFLSGKMGGQVLVTLSEQEIYLYNLFYAAIAIAVGFSFTARFIFLKNLGQATKQRFLIRNTLSNQGFFTWSFLYWFGKMTVILGIWYTIFPLQFDIDFLKDASLFLIVLPIVVFLNVWLDLRKVLEKRSILYFSMSLILFLLLSFSFAFKNFIPKGSIDENYRRNSIEHFYDLQLPRTEYLDRIRRVSLAIEIYAVLDRSKGNAVKIIFGDRKEEVMLDKLKSRIESEKEKFSFVERSNLTYNLIIDRRVKLVDVKDIVNIIRKCGSWGVQYSTAAKHSKYPSYYSGFKSFGIHEYLPPYNSELEMLLDSAESINFSNYKISAPASNYYRVPYLLNTNRIIVRRDARGISINNEIIGVDKFQDVILQFVKKYSPNCVVVFQPDYRISYGDYIEIKDLLYSQIEKLRSEYSIVELGQPYNKNHRDSIYNVARQKYPLNVVEWTKEEQRIIKLLDR